MFQNFRKEAYTVVKSQGEYASGRVWQLPTLGERVLDRISCFFTFNFKEEQILILLTIFLFHMDIHLFDIGVHEQNYFMLIKYLLKICS